MEPVGLPVTLRAKPGKENELAALLAGALPLVADEAGREAHLSGQVAAVLMENAPELLAASPSIERADVLAEKLP